LKRFPSDEWSGPAFYELKKDEKGVPVEWVLHGFHPLDLGGSTSTEWDGEDFLKIRKKLLLDNPIYAKCYQGIIHSHHTMGAFLSGTDKGHIEEAANLVGYPSLVVASSGVPFAFGYSYIDQFWEVQIYEVEAKDISLETPEVQPEKEWVKNADEIKKAKKVSPVNVYNSFRGRNSQQNNLWGTYQAGYNMYDEIPNDEDLRNAEKRLRKAKKQYKRKQINLVEYNRIKQEYKDIKEVIDDFNLDWTGGTHV
jgi:hypothetical protein